MKKMTFAPFVVTLTLLLVLVILQVTQPLAAQSQISIIGFITDPQGQPLAGVVVGAVNASGGSETTTDGSGRYALSLPIDAYVHWYVRPQVESRLSHINIFVENPESSLELDYQLETGNLISGRVTLPDSTPLTEEAFISVTPVNSQLPADHFFQVVVPRESGETAFVVPPDLYTVDFHYPPDPTLDFLAVIDNSGGDLVGVDFKLLPRPKNPYPPDPPDASKISLLVNEERHSISVVGESGAVVDYGHVLLVNLSSHNMVHLLANADGSFSTEIFGFAEAPLLIKHDYLGGPSEWRWGLISNGAGEQLNPIPSTIIHAPPVMADNSSTFSISGPLFSEEVNIAETAQRVPAIWRLNGSSSLGQTIAATETVVISGTLEIHNPSISPSTDTSQIEVASWINLARVFDENGIQTPIVNSVGSSRLTPSRFPILDKSPAEVHLPTADFNLSPWRFVSEGVLAADYLLVSEPIPNDIPQGTYLPKIGIGMVNSPQFEDAGWLAASVYREAGLFFNEGGLPLVSYQDENRESDQTPERLMWHLLINDVQQGTRGVTALEDRDHFQFTSYIASQGARYILAPRELESGELISYRLEPFLPLISWTDRLQSSPPIIPFELPGGSLSVTVQMPDGMIQDLGSEAFTQSFLQSQTTPYGEDLNGGSVQVNDVYGLRTAGDRFDFQFETYGRHVITMTGTLDDIWGNRYAGGGRYEIWIAEPLDIEFGVLPGTPLAAGDAFNPSLRVQPGLPADVAIHITHFPESDPSLAQIFEIKGQANAAGYFNYSGSPIRLEEHGEYRVDIDVTYLDEEDGTLYMGSATWGSIVMTPPADGQLVAHGRRGIDNLTGIPNQWSVLCAISPPPEAGTIPHIMNAYFNGDVIWARSEDPGSNCDGDALIMHGTIQDRVGNIEAAIEERYLRCEFGLSGQPSFEERKVAQSLPLFSSTTNGASPSLYPGQIDQIAYAYLSSQRPGVRVRETISEESHHRSYWRYGTQYDYQTGVGVLGDLPNDFKFQYVGAVYRDLETGYREYAGQGSGWVHLAESDTVGSRIMPPFAGPGNGGWTTAGGPLLTLKGEDIHLFMLPTGIRPGDLLELNDVVHFAGHIMPTLDSHLLVEIESPSGQTFMVNGQANQIGYFYDPAYDFVVEEAGKWIVDVTVWHTGQIGTGEMVNCDPSSPFAIASPCPSGDILGSQSGRFYFYVRSQAENQLPIQSPSPGYLEMTEEIEPIGINGLVPAGLTDVEADYTITMPGFILDQGSAGVNGNRFSFQYDPATLHADFPNIDLLSREGYHPGLADAITISIFLSGMRDGAVETWGNTVTLHGEQVHVGAWDQLGLIEFKHTFLPAIFN